MQELIERVEFQRDKWKRKQVISWLGRHGLKYNRILKSPFCYRVYLNESDYCPFGHTTSSYKLPLCDITLHFCYSTNKTDDNCSVA
jgi:hypothetical protein